MAENENFCQYVVFFCRDITVPEQAGSYCMLLLYSPSGNTKLKSEPVSIQAILLLILLFFSHIELYN